MAFLSRFAPAGALRDLRFFLASRGQHEIVFLFAALIGTGVIIGLFILDAPPKVEPKEPEIIYVESWPLNRSDAEIRAQQKIDKPIEDARRAEIERRQKERQQQFKRIDDSLKKWGI